MPWSILSKMGAGFAGRFIRWIQEQEHSQVWVAKSADGRVLGIAGATLDRPRIYREIVRKHAVAIACSVLMNLWRPGVLVWLGRALRGRLRPLPDVSRVVPRPAAEGLFLALVEEARGSGLALRLCDERESAFRAWGLIGPYVILTLSTNKRVHAFHTKRGCKLVAQVPTRGHLIYEFHKELPPDDT
ncbi:MAG TPA: GNAT family N-acetyltransferase [Phycisphaerae bacterium]|nr:GNAT family N-acetyltransferase [Phycisphaerae bacterium]